MIMRTGTLMNAIYNRFGEIDTREGFTVYKRFPIYHFSMHMTLDETHVEYVFDPYMGGAFGRHYILPKETLEKIDVSEKAEWLDDQLEKLDIIYTGIAIDAQIKAAIAEERKNNMGARQEAIEMGIDPNKFM